MAGQKPKRNMGARAPEAVVPKKWKAMYWTVAFAAVTVVGTIYGAGLKIKTEYKEEKKKLVEAPIDDRIAALETRRGQLLGQRMQIEKKLTELRRKMAEEPEGRNVGGGRGDGGK